MQINNYFGEKDKIERIVVIYRVIGRWIWLAKMMTEIQVYPLTLILY